MTTFLSLAGTLALTSLSLLAATPQGDYVLVEQGLAGTRDFAVLARLTLDGAGNVAGTEVVRATATNLTAEVKGTYTMSSAHAGSLALTVIDSSDSDAAPVTQNYRFLVTGSGELQAIRTDAGVLSVSTLTPSRAAPNSGALALVELDKGAVLLAQLALDGNGAVSGAAHSFGAAGEAQPAVSGSYTAPVKGLGSLVLHLTTRDDDGNEIVETRSYHTAATAGGVSAIRMDTGTVSVSEWETL